MAETPSGQCTNASDVLFSVELSAGEMCEWRRTITLPHSLSNDILFTMSLEGRGSNVRLRRWYIWRLHSLGGGLPDYLRAVHAVDSLHLHNLLHNDGLLSKVLKGYVECIHAALEFCGSPIGKEVALYVFKS